jgi:hypothetical protein
MSGPLKFKKARDNAAGGQGGQAPNGLRTAFARIVDNLGGLGDLLKKPKPWAT